MLVSEYKKLYDSGEWWGLYQLWLDWEHDRWVLPHLLGWYGNLPDWINNT